ncbi:uncharacterized protein HMPREF1541_07970 [Cyphellophora europaea CBS 101466]|uniref:Telomere length regulation protein conserved domain-containing protein n=1 Tax=Cyphellophora europaea (strain CBS 101466) TaxID=1220924 RepID=W2RKH3_CYPE1|nr:uncharacterized protein HMPREF1541_07970 [Cyphellophora europaea CBS 101466]ETN36982.1 hypothetical protein HMPREF1541_07970 [Cyphellophora europaea CBS 101466]
MDQLLNLERSKSAGKVKGNIDKFESLSLREHSNSDRPTSAKSKRSILEITSTASSDDISTSDSFDLQISKQPSKASSQTTVEADPASDKRRKRESAAFLQKSYLNRESDTIDSLPDDAKAILKSQPDYEDLLAVLQYLECGIQGKHDFNVHVTGPNASQIINALVTVTIPDHWPVLRIHKLPKQHELVKQLIVLTFRSVAGIGALLMQIRKLGANPRENTSILEDTIAVLQLVLHKEQFLGMMLRDARRLSPKETQRRLHWQEVVSLVGGSKILSFVAQAMTAGHISTGRLKWLGDGNEYCKWLAKNVAIVAIDLSPQDLEAWVMLAQVVKRALNLGYRADTFVSELYHSLLLGNQALWTPLRTLLNHLTAQEQRLFFDAMLRDLVRKYLRHGPVTSPSQKNGLESESNVGGVAAMVSGMAQNNTVLEDHIVQWLTSTNGKYASLGLDTRRAVIATLALRQDKLQSILDKCLENFGDKLQIQHNPILQQESMAEVLLLTIGYLHRMNPEAIRLVSKSGVFLHTVSSRLSASVPRVRLLGMIIATAVSRLVDGPEKAMSFGVDELEADESQHLLDLVNIKDEVGSIQKLRTQDYTPKPDPIESNILPRVKVRRSTRPQQSKIIAIEEIEDDPGEESEDEDLIPYQKPDEDPSDSDDDPTLINRDKPSAPVYIIDLIKQLQSDEKPDVIELALKTAPSLIRRKANFGTEISDNVQVVASALMNLRSPILDTAELHRLRLESLIACLISQPRLIAPWLASLYFEGDYSLDQRASILSTLGIGAREFAGLDTPTPTSESSVAFPSQQLPPRLASIYAPIESTARQIEHSTMQPLALAAADKLSGPDVLKVRTFSSRLDVEKRRKEQAAARTKRIPKDLHKLLAECFFLPLCSRLSLVLSSNTIGFTRSSSIFDPNIIRLYLQTLIIVLNALGPNAVELGTVTREALVLLEALTGQALALDAVVLPAVLHLLLVVLDLTVEAGRAAEERLITELGATVAEVMRWVGGLEDRGVPVVDVEGVGGGLQWNALAAGLQVKWHEMGGRWQGRMLGLMGVEGMDFD